MQGELLPAEAALAVSSLRSLEFSGRQNDWQLDLLATVTLEADGAELAIFAQGPWLDRSLLEEDSKSLAVLRLEQLEDFAVWPGKHFLQAL